MAEIERPVSASALIEGLEIQDRIQGDIFLLWTFDSKFLQTATWDLGNVSCQLLKLHGKMWNIL